MLTTIKAVLGDKGRDVWSVSPESTVYDALRMMADKRIEALLVLWQGTLVGIITERDCARRVTLQGREAMGVRVSDVMTSPVVFVTPAHTVGDCIRIATEKSIAHLPVLEGETVTGVVSLGDLVKSIIRDQGTTISHLEGYISGNYPG